MLLYHLALVSQTESVTLGELALVASAIQKQVMRDFSPIWNINATVDAFADLMDVPLGYWPIIIMDDINRIDVLGYHEDDSNQPYAVVQYSNSWSIAVSHEALEIITDPYGNRLVTSNAIQPKQERVQYLVEVCDPCQGAAFAYNVNGIMVSDFYTPNYFDPIESPGVRYSFTGSIRKPLEVLKGGYISWLVPTSNEWYQASYFGSILKIQKINGMQNLTTGSLRSRIDSLTKVDLFIKGITNKKMLALKKLKMDAVMLASESKAKVLLKLLDKI